MSQSEIQKLLYGALASGSDAGSNDKETDVAAILAAQCGVDAVVYAHTPAEVLAHYDFRAKSCHIDD